jgi:DNA polymerase III delta prime subunit
VRCNLKPRNFLRGSIKRCKKFIPEYLKELYLDDLKIFSNNYIILEQVKIIKKQKRKKIYDFHIPNTNSFLANGIINHNTTLGKAIINELKCDYININSSDDRKLETVREKVKQFCLTKSSKENLKRCVFLDEAEGMTKFAQDALRNMMETYESNAFFILTANNVHRVIEPLQSRCKMISFAYPSKDDIYPYLEGICKNENMDYTEEGIKKLIDLNYPSIRNCVNVLQDLFVSGKPVLPENVKPFNAIFDDIWELIQQKNYPAIKKLILQGTLEPRDLNMHIWEKSVENDNFKIMQITCRNEKDIADGASPKVIFISSVPEMIK